MANKNKIPIKRDRFKKFKINRKYNYHLIYNIRGCLIRIRTKDRTLKNNN